jgi:hypothetical protein
VSAHYYDAEIAWDEAPAETRGTIIDHAGRFFGRDVPEAGATDWEDKTNLRRIEVNANLTFIVIGASTDTNVLEPHVRLCLSRPMAAWLRDALARAVEEHDREIAEDDRRLARDRERRKAHKARQATLAPGTARSST